MLVQNTDGTLRVIVRTPGGIVEVISKDYGKSWSGGQLVTNSNGDIMSRTSSRPYIRSIMDEDGRVTGKTQIFIFHDNDTAARSDLTVALSEDGGKTWKYKLELADTEGCSYPDACQTSDGTIYITYDIDRYSQKKVMMARITVDDIKAGKIVSENSKLVMLINDNGVTAAGGNKLMGTDDIEVKNIANIKPVDGASVVEKLKSGMYLFVDRQHSAKNIPEYFKGAKVLKTSMTNGTEFETTSAGELYILTPMNGLSYSHQAELEAMGFVAAEDNIGDFFNPQLEKLVLLKKDVEAGERFKISKYSIVIAGTKS